MTQLEKEFAQLVVRFADDLAKLVRRAPLAEIEALLGTVGEAPSKSWREQYKLTPREAAVLEAAVKGMSRAEIASTHGMALFTVKTHAHRLLRKTGDASLLAAAARLMREAGRV